MNKIINIILIIAGIIFIILGLLGIFLPLLPTTPFLLVSASCFIKGSSKLYNWLVNNRLLGQYIKNYHEGKGMTKWSKIIAITLLWAANIYTIIFMVSNELIKIIIILIAICVTWHIASLKNLK